MFATDAMTMGDVLPVGDDDMGFVLFFEAGQLTFDDRAAKRSKDVSNE
jgi:glutamate mutase epsilon subunit